MNLCNDEGQMEQQVSKINQSSIKKVTEVSSDTCEMYADIDTTEMAVSLRSRLFRFSGL